MKILLCHNHYQQPGGESESFASEARLLESRGHEVLQFTRHNNTIHDMDRWKLAASTIWNRECGREVSKLIALHKPDVLHCTNTFPLISPSVYYAAKAAGVPVVQSLRNFRPLCVNGYLLRDGKPCEDCVGRLFAWPGILRGCYQESKLHSAGVGAMQLTHRLLRTWTRAVDIFFTPSEHARSRFIVGGFPADRVVVKPNFIEEDPGVGAGNGGYAFFAGRLAPEKGVQTLLAAWAQLQAPLELQIAGDGPLAGQVQEASRRDPRIRWLGWLPQREVVRFFSDAACVLVPSLWYETFGRTIIEAYASGTPAIVSRLGAMAELVDHGRTGFHFEPGDAADLAAKVDCLYSDSQRTAQMRVNARQEYERHYTAEANYHILQNIYARALGRRRITGPANEGDVMTNDVSLLPMKP